MRHISTTMYVNNVTSSPLGLHDDVLNDIMTSWNQSGVMDYFYDPGGSGTTPGTGDDEDNFFGGVTGGEEGGWKEGEGEGSEGYFDDYMKLSSRDHLPPELPPRTRFIFTVLYIVVITLGFTGNATTVLVIAVSRELRTVTNVFLVSLAISDGLIAGLNMPIQLKTYLQNEWTLGNVMCKFFNYSQGVVIVASILTLTALAIDRYYAICHPLRARHLHTLTRAVLVVSGIWVTSLLLLILQLFIQRQEPLFVVENGTPRIAHVCVEFFNEDPGLSIAYTSFFYIFLYALPVLIMLVTYGKIAHRLWSRAPIGEITTSSQRESTRRLAEKKRIVCMLVVIVVMFTINWFPFFTFQIYLLLEGDSADADFTFDSTSSEGSPDSLEGGTELQAGGGAIDGVGGYLGGGGVPGSGGGGAAGTHRLTMAYLQLLGYSNCCVNPIIYCFMNDSFQKSLFKAFNCLGLLESRRRRRRSSTGLVSLQTGSAGGGSGLGLLGGRRQKRRRRRSSCTTDGGDRTLHGTTVTSMSGSIGGGSVGGGQVSPLTPCRAGYRPSLTSLERCTPV